MTNIQLKLMELGISCPFQILNTRIRSGPDMDPKNYEYFMGILIIDPNRPGPEKNRFEPEPKISKGIFNPTPFLL